ncbi:hypothetical protein [Chenggangzhangella methanolivorans]|uniref:Uncharacterized protein n=1 Tax=Chenggangzhangella methanolivorans TaxID=1437009 RepID=A0A9E6R7I1_9HYPH|nr:hypothetical protein [Chenggangzhangella methanolivorans]QZN98709.1 hypothetical protein K6K41_17130 [Chenggangzhangella methanolivorans]
MTKPSRRAQSPSLVAAACFAIALLAPADASARSDAFEALIAQWTDLNSACRGGSGDDPKTMKACDERETIGARLKKGGWCYGRPGDAGYQRNWIRCGS